MEESTKLPSFEGLGINDTFLQMLAKHRFSVPTPIQLKAIPVALSGDDVIGIAQTGTGKTIAFGIPLLQRMHTGVARGISLILVPTRELAMQVEQAIAKFGRELGLRTAVLIGGERADRQIRQLRMRPHIIVATPGRLLDMIEQRALALDNTKMLVLDEADRMLDMGFAPQINQIFKLLPKPQDRQTMLFSATMPDDIVRIANTHMRLPIRVEVAPAGSTVEKVIQELYIVKREDKFRLLTEELLRTYTGSVLVFTRTKYGAKKLTEQLERVGVRAAEIHANKTLVQRIRALEGFKRGTYRVLVATDIAARGIDVTNIELVVNFDLPDNPEDYVHRIGRTARAGLGGHAVSLATPDQRTDIRTIERLIRKPLPVAKHAKLSVELPSIPVAQRGIAGGRMRRFGHRPHFRRQR